VENTLKKQTLIEINYCCNGTGKEAPEMPAERRAQDPEPGKRPSWFEQGE